MKSVMISKNGAIKMEDTYDEWYGYYRKEFNTWLSKWTKVITIDPDVIAELDTTRK